MIRSKMCDADPASYARAHAYRKIIILRFLAVLNDSLYARDSLRSVKILKNRGWLSLHAHEGRS